MYHITAYLRGACPRASVVEAITFFSRVLLTTCKLADSRSSVLHELQIYNPIHRRQLTKTQYVRVQLL